jgi:tetratricopeptide (TPR) repeat protein
VILLLTGAGMVWMAGRSLRAALGIRRPGPDDPDAGRSLNNRGALAQAEGDLRLAAALFARAIAILETTAGVPTISSAIERCNLAAVCVNLAAVERSAARDREAQALLDRADSLLCGSTDRAAAIVGAARLVNEAALQRTRGDHAAAAERLARAVTLREEARGPDHLDTARALVALAVALSRCGDPHADRTFARAVSILEHHGAPTAGRLGSALHELGEHHARRGRFDDAEGAMGRAIAVKLSVSPADETSVSRSRRALASILASRGRLRDADALRSAAAEAASSHPDPPPGRHVDLLDVLLLPVK